MLEQNLINLIGKNKAREREKKSWLCGFENIYPRRQHQILIIWTPAIFYSLFWLRSFTIRWWNPGDTPCCKVKAFYQGQMPSSIAWQNRMFTPFINLNLFTFLPMPRPSFNSISISGEDFFVSESPDRAESGWSILRHHRVANKPQQGCACLFCAI